MLKQNNLEELVQAIRDGRMVPERSREYWSAEERRELTALYQAGMGITQIAVQLQRSEMAVVQQLMGMGLLTPPGAARAKRPRAPRCLCEVCQLADECPKSGTCAGEERNAGTLR